MVSAGVTVLDPVSGTLPIPLSNVTEVALEEFHVRVAVSPVFMVEGATAILIAGPAMIVTVADAVVTPPGPDAVAV